MRILVTGASGYIGQSLVPLLKSRHTVLPCANRTSRPNQYAVKMDVTEYPEVLEVIDGFRPDAIIHLAGISTVKSDNSDVFYVNVGGTLNVLEAAPKGCRFVLASSCSVYGSSDPDDKWGTAFTEQSKTNPESVYAASKLACESLVQAYTNLGLVRGISARLVAQVGPFATHGLFYDVVAKLRSSSEFLELFGDSPGSCKPFMHVQETCSCLQFMAESNVSGIVNIAPGDSLTVDGFATICMRELGIRKPIKWLGKKANFVGDSPYLFVSGKRASDMMRPWYSKSSAEAIYQALANMKTKEQS